MSYAYTLTKYAFVVLSVVAMPIDKGVVDVMAWIDSLTNPVVALKVKGQTIFSTSFWYKSVSNLKYS